MVLSIIFLSSNAIIDVPGAILIFLYQHVGTEINHISLNFEHPHQFEMI